MSQLLSFVQVPDNDDTTKHSLSLEDRHKLGSRIVTRFLIGTLYNLLAGLAGAMAGARLQQILTRGFLL